MEFFSIKGDVLCCLVRERCLNSRKKARPEFFWVYSRKNAIRRISGWEKSTYENSSVISMRRCIPPFWGSVASNGSPLAVLFFTILLPRKLRVAQCGTSESSYGLYRYKPSYPKPERS